LQPQDDSQQSLPQPLPHRLQLHNRLKHSRMRDKKLRTGVRRQQSLPQASPQASPQQSLAAPALQQSLPQPQHGAGQTVTGTCSQIVRGTQIVHV
jgi:hypothetical protein